MPQPPSTTWRMLAKGNREDKLPQGLDAAWETMTGLVSRGVPRTFRYLRRAARVVAYETEMSALTDARLREEALKYRDIFRCGRESRTDLERAFAVVREAATRELGETPFPVQVAGAFAIEDGCVAEMATGEGKTLTATMPATVAGWRGRGCHVVTVNDYLAKRDADWMGKIYRFCGVSVAAIAQESTPPERKLAYLADITYCTNKEVTADFLRDRLALGKVQGLASSLLGKIATGRGFGMERVVQRGLGCAIVDEADSILIDEAVTPLIISGNAPNEDQVEAFQAASDICDSLQVKRDYRVDPRYREIHLTREGKERIEALSEGLGGLWRGVRRREELVTQALTAHELYSLDKQYVIDEGEVVIVDEFTGRLMPDRTWRDGLHQAVEAKESLEVNPPKDTYARVSFQRFFRQYEKLSGMTGTAAEGIREFWQIYHSPIAIIPTNEPCIRKVRKDRVYATADAKWNAIVEEIKTVHAAGRPILIGTRSVGASEHLSRMLAEEELEHSVLNAVRHAEEAQIVAGAGKYGCITVATNMAGRGTNILLGKGIAEMGGLCVIATERHEAGRIDRQLFGRCARQGAAGNAGAFVSLQDELVTRHAPHLSRILRNRYGKTPREISSFTTRHAMNMAQHGAERLSLKQRKSVLRTDDWLDEYLGFAGSEG